MKHKFQILFVIVFVFSACSPVTPTSLSEILPTPKSIASFDERILATINITYPDEIVFVQDFIWVKTDDGHVIQVDPITNTVVNDIKVDTTSDPYHYCQGLGTDGENIWACSASGDADHKSIDVVRIDPKTLNITETIKVEKNFDQFDMPFLSNRIWILSGSGDKLVGIDVATNEPTSAIELGVRCFQLAVVNQSLFATCSLDDVILQIDPEKGEITKRIDINSPVFMVGNENGIWVTQDNTLTRLDPKTLMPVTEYSQLGNMGSGDIFLTDDAVWLRVQKGFLYRIDPATNEIIEQIQSEEILSGGSVLVTSDSIWTTAADDDLLFRLSLK